jgi:hypothetical protein
VTLRTLPELRNLLDNPTPRPYDCPKCFMSHKDCLGHTRAGKPCGMRAVDGADVCIIHGARAPQVKAAAQDRVERARAERAVATYGLPQDIDPFDALSQELNRTQGHVMWLSAIIADMDPGALVWGETSIEEGEGTGAKEGSTYRIKSEAGVNVWLQLYYEERKHLKDVAKTCIACGIAQRELDLLERYSEMMANALGRIFDDPELAFDTEMKEKMLAVASRHLRAA